MNGKLEKNSYLTKVAVKKSLLKEYTDSQNDRIVYLNDGDEFQLQFFNPYTDIIGAEIYFDNSKISEKTIIIRPGERIWLDRFLDSNNKFKFYTYTVNNSNEVKSAIRYNGLIHIKFYRELKISYSPGNYNFIYNPYNPITVTYDNPVLQEYTTTYCSSLTGSETAVNLGAASLSAADYSYSTAASTITGDNEPAKYTNFTNKIETGKIGQGDISNQELKSTYVNLETYPFCNETIRILPMSTKPVYKNDLKKLYCTECGRKIKDKYKFCPFCGAKL